MPPTDRSSGVAGSRRPLRPRRRVSAVMRAISGAAGRGMTERREVPRFDVVSLGIGLEAVRELDVVVPVNSIDLFLPISVFQWDAFLPLTIIRSNVLS